MRNITKARIKIASLAGVAIVAGLVTYVAVMADQTPSPNVVNGVDQTALAQCLAQSSPHVECQATVPGLAECMAKHLVCNQAADSFRRAHFGPAQAGAPTMTESEATSAAVSFSSDSTQVTSTVAREMKYSDYLAIVGELPDPIISSDRLVWVVTVHGPILPISVAPGAPASARAPMAVYTVVFDATSKQSIELCGGCASLG